jgi:hypothetical protein
MKLTEMNLKLAEELMSWWINTGITRHDNLKDPDVLFNTMFNDGGKSQFYALPGLLFIVTDILPGVTGTLYEVGALKKNYDPKEAKHELVGIVKEFSLNRLTYSCPSAVTGLSSAMKDMGLKYEGRVKYSCIYNGILGDTDLYGFYSIMPERARRRRGRRNARKEAPIANGTGNFAAEQDSFNGEEIRSRNPEGRDGSERENNAGSDETGSGSQDDSRHDSHGEQQQSAS